MHISDSHIYGDMLSSLSLYRSYLLPDRYSCMLVICRNYSVGLLFADRPTLLLHDRPTMGSLSTARHGNR